MRKPFEFFVIKEWILLPFSIYEAIKCSKPHMVSTLMEDIPDENKIIPYRVIMYILRFRL